MSCPIKIKITSERRADTKREKRGVEKIDKKLFHGFGPLKRFVISASFAPGVSDAEMPGPRGRGCFEFSDQFRIIGRVEGLEHFAPVDFVLFDRQGFQVVDFVLHGLPFVLYSGLPFPRGRFERNGYFYTCKGVCYNLLQLSVCG